MAVGGRGQLLGQHSFSLGKQSGAGQAGTEEERVRELQRISRQKAAAAQVGGGPVPALPTRPARLRGWWWVGRPGHRGQQKPEGN